MNIIEAAKSGKRFKRKAHPHYADGPNYCVSIDGLDYADILADDWELEPDRKSRLLAWRTTYGAVLMAPENSPSALAGGWIRLPHLDEPEAT